MITLSSVCDPAVERSLVGGDIYPHKLQKCVDALRIFTMLNVFPESSRQIL